jgi:predicted nucleotidyltransferase
MVAQPKIDLPMDAIRDFCERWKIREFALFGSVLREDFRPDSDVDVLVTFEDPTAWGLLDRARMQRELSGLLGRNVDLSRRDGVEQSPNPHRRRQILKSAQVVYEG